jgi:NAD(P)H-nitrite reductase large subunit
MKQYVIIGNSAAGVAAIEAIRQRDKESKLVVISDEGYSAYCRCLISYFLAGDVKEELHLNKKVTRVDPKKNRVTCSDKTIFDYDSLLIATGARPKFPEKIKGIKKTGVYGFRTIKDTLSINGVLPVTKAACVLGGGLVGLKAAYALKKRGIEVKVIIRSAQVLSQMLDKEAALIAQKVLEENGIELYFGQDVSEVIGDGDLKAVKLDSGKVFGCSLVIVGKGVEPNIDLVKDTQVKFNEGIIAAAKLDTNIPNIYAAGDVCESFDLTMGRHAVNALWPVAVRQGKIAGANMTGENINYEGSLGMNAIEFFGLPVVSLGVYRLKDADASVEELRLSNAKDNLYKKFLIRDNLLIGALLVGNIKNSGVFLRLIREKINVSTLKDKLLSDNFGYPDIMNLVKEKENVYV